MRFYVRGVAKSLALASILFACAPHPPPPEAPSALLGVDASGTPCESACAHLAAFHCPEAKPTKGGVACPELCERGQTLENMPTACLGGATSLAAVRACGVRCAD